MQCIYKLSITYILYGEKTKVRENLVNCNQFAKFLSFMYEIHDHAVCVMNMHVMQVTKMSLYIMK